MAHVPEYANCVSSLVFALTVVKPLQTQNHAKVVLPPLRERRR